MKKTKPHTVDWAQIERFLASADQKLASAHKILAIDEEACLQQAYEAMLRASLGCMFSHGLRARSQPDHHIAIIEFVRGPLTPSTLACSQSSTVYAESGTWRPMMTRDSFRITKQRKPSNRPVDS
jgi:hypothetical protein